ncbi:hypothetical protein GCM10007380_20360 [Gottfriedia solisilvae]|uniref:Uncharacterized protein n=1 Tax=Gottfriedia solisilvae TaxID=1516104 RepID=A0A8J3ANA3_9BACI|nr:hypothetical protein GCM10007380_20360 [Gottfriedia solisilvae]
MLKSTVIQSILFSLMVHLIILFINIKLVLSLFQPKSNHDFGFHDSYFVVYHGIFENLPVVGIIIGLIITFIFIAIVYIIIKWLCNYIFRLLNRNTLR